MADFKIPTLNHWPQVIPLGDGDVIGSLKVVLVSTDYDAQYGDLVEGDSTAAGFNVTLPAASDAASSSSKTNIIVVKNEFGSNAVDIVAAGGDTLDQGATTFPLAPGAYRFLVSDGVSNWITVAQGPDYINVLAFPGADLGAKIQAADTFLGNTPGTLFVPDGNYTWSTHCSQLHPNRVLQFGAGVITCIGQNPFFFPYPGPMAILNDNTIVQGKGSSTIFDEPDSSVLFAPLTSAGFNNVNFRDFTVQNIANGEPLQLGTSLPNIGFDNSKDSTALNLTFINTRSLSISAGGTSAGGDHANGIDVSHCIFDGVKCITLACVNGRNINYNHLFFKNVGTSGPSAPYAAVVCIDLEPNTGTDLMENFAVSDCTFDMRGNKGGSCILVQGAGVGRNGVVANNLIECGTDASLGTTAGITVNGQTDVLVVGNVITGQFSQLPVDINGCTRVTFATNTVRSSGGPLSGFRAVIIRGGSVSTKIFGNIISVAAADVGWASIADDNSCSLTQVFGNTLTGLGTVANPLPTIELSGAGDQQWSNILNGVMQQGAVTRPHRLVNANTAIAITDEIIGVNTGSAWTITLPDPTVVGVGALFTVSDETGGAAANNITIAPHGAELINGANASVLIKTAYGRATLYTDGTNWFASFSPPSMVFLVDTQLATGSGTENQGSAVFADIASYPTATFAVPYGGTFEIFAMLKGIYGSGAQGEFQLLVDGVAVPTTVEQYPFDVNAYTPVILRGAVTLAAGNRVVKAQWRNVNGAGLNLDKLNGGVAYGSRTYGIRN